MGNIWLLTHCPEGQEEKIAEAIQPLINGGNIREAFVMTYACLKRYQGKWHTEQKSLFPGYLMLESEEGQMNTKELSFIEKNTPFQKVYTALNHEEESFLRNISDSGHHIPMSRGYIHNGKTYITEGPLSGMESCIRHIDRHKRLATVEIPGIRGRKIQIGLEIFRKD